MTVWVSVFVQLLVLDVASYLAEHTQGLGWFFQYRFLVLLGMVCAFWLVLGTRRFMLFFGYVLAYPFVVTFWTLPRFLFRNWAVLVAFSPAVHSILSTFKSSFILFTAALISACLVGLSSNRRLIVVCMVFLGVYLAVHYARRFRVAFSPSTTFADVGGAIHALWSDLKQSDMARRPAGLASDSEEYKQKVGQNLLSLYMMTAALYIVGERLGQVVKSRKLDLYFLSSLLYTFFLTAVAFAIKYLGLNRLDPRSFSGSTDRGFLQFLGLSFSTLMTSGVSPLKPVSGGAQAGSYLELFSSLLIVVLLVFVVLTSIRERYRQDLDGVVGEIAAASASIGGLLESNYDLTMAGAEAWLLKFNPAVTKWCLKLRHGEKRAREIVDSANTTAPDGPAFPPHTSD